MNKQIAALAVFFTALSGSAVLALPGNDDRVVATALPGGIANLSRTVGYVQGAKGGVDAVDMATGKMLWHTDGDLTPLLVVGQRVFAQDEANPATNELRVVALDTKRGQQVFFSKPIVFPDWVSTASVGLGSTFQSQAEVAGSLLLFHWHATKHQISGAAPPPGVTLGHWDQSGIARVTLSTGDVTMLPPPAQDSPLSADIAPDSPVTLGGRTFTMKEEPAAFDAPHLRSLQCADATGRLLWQYPIKPRPMDLSFEIP